MHGRWQMQKIYPRKFQSETMTNVNRYPIYRCRDTRCTILVHGIELDNRWVVPHNVYLSTKYNAHINVEVCNNIHAIKYLFKYDDDDVQEVAIDGMVQNKPIIESCTKPYVQSIP